MQSATEELDHGQETGLADFRDSLFNRVSRRRLGHDVISAPADQFMEGNKLKALQTKTVYDPGEEVQSRLFFPLIVK